VAELTRAELFEGEGTASDAIREIGLRWQIVTRETSFVTADTLAEGQILTREFLQRVPAGRSYQQAVHTAAGVTGGGGNPTMAGSNWNENTYMLDGGTLSDPVTGTFSVNFNYDAVPIPTVRSADFIPREVALSGVPELAPDTASIRGEGILPARSNIRLSVGRQVAVPSPLDLARGTGLRLIGQFAWTDAQRTPRRI
jgi:hypothetical protein